MEKGDNICGLLFDLGGVVVEFDFARAVAAAVAQNKVARARSQVG